MNKPSKRAIGPETARKRRKEARPGELVEAALESFLEYGFEGTKLDEVAKRAGVAKGTIYLYFETKEQLFRAVVRHAIENNVGSLHKSIAEFDGPFDALISMVLKGAAQSVSSSRTPAVARLVLREAERVPDLARIWFDEVAAPMLNALREAIAKAELRGEVQTGDPTAHLFSIIGPMLLLLLSRDVFGSLGFNTPDPVTLAEQHTQTLIHGLLR